MHRVCGITPMRVGTYIEGGNVCITSAKTVSLGTRLGTDINVLIFCAYVAQGDNNQNLAGSGNYVKCHHAVCVLLIIGTYDVQAVGISLQDENLRINCSFIENSLARGCLLSVCLSIVGELDLNTCGNFTVPRTDPASVIRLSVVGTYLVSGVADIEQDGSMSAIADITVFGLLIAYPPVTTVIVPVTISKSVWQHSWRLSQLSHL